MISQVGSTHGSTSIHQVALPGVLKSAGSAQPSSYMMGSVQSASQVNTRTNFMYGGTPMVRVFLFCNKMMLAMTIHLKLRAADQFFYF